MKNEYEFYRYLQANWPGHYVRIENAIGSGLPDINSCYKGREAWFEVKFDTLKIRKFQNVWGLRRAQAGGLVWVISFNKRLNTVSVYKHPLFVSGSSEILGPLTVRVKKEMLFDKTLFSLLHGIK